MTSLFLRTQGKRTVPPGTISPSDIYPYSAWLRLELGVGLVGLVLGLELELGLGLWFGLGGMSGRGNVQHSDLVGESRNDEDVG